jgi:hypothetical protein
LLQYSNRGCCNCGCVRKELTGTYAVCEVKRQNAKIDLNAVAEKFAAFQKATGKWLKAKPRFLALSMSDM